jgi:hypothetical protein
MGKVYLEQGADYEGQTLVTYTDMYGDEYVMPMLSDGRGYQVPIDYQHHLVHMRKVFTISHTFLNVAIGGKVSVALIADGYPLHIPDFVINSDVKVRLKSYLNPTITPDTGTEYIPFNRVSSNSVSFGGTVILSPTFTGGTLRGNDFSGSSSGTGTNAYRAGGNRSGGIESVVDSNDILIYEFENAGTAVTDINIIVNLYENSIPMLIGD